MTESGQAVNFNPSNAPVTPQEEDGFAARVTVKSSRFTKSNYVPSLGWGDKVVITWTCISTKGNEFDKQWSTGLNWDEKCTVSPDGRRLIAKDEEFSGIRPNSDANYLLNRAIESGFPGDKITNDIGVFDGTAFLIADAKNPNAKGSKKKPYPKKFYPQGLEAAVSEQAAKKVAQQTAAKPATPAAVAEDVKAIASNALGQAVAAAGGTINRNALLSALNSIEDLKSLDKSKRQAVSVALWDLGQLASVVAVTPGLALHGDTVSVAE